MKLLWLCNMIPGAVQEAISGETGGGLWVDHVLNSLRRQNETIRILCRGQDTSGTVTEAFTFRTFREDVPHVYLPELEDLFLEELRDFHPDVIHVWGTEYGHTLAMVNAAERLGMLDKLVISIQGLCSVIAKHYTEGIPHNIQKRFTFRDFVKQNNILQQQSVFAARGKLEIQALEKARHVIGRTHWDEACVRRVHPDIQYHFCNETLREPFYEGQWDYNRCERHSIFVPSCSYPIKGFHIVLEAMQEVCKSYPDAKLYVTGSDFLNTGFRAGLRQTNYQKYMRQLVKEYGLESHINFLGSLPADGMKQAYLRANVFVLPSTIENSPNSLGEAMLLGVPCVASDVGGVTTMMTHQKEGFVYQSTAPYMLAYYIKKVFAMKEEAAEIGLAAREHAGKTHDPQKNLQDLLAIYDCLK